MRKEEAVRAYPAHLSKCRGVVGVSVTGDSIVSVGEGADAIGEDVALVIFGGESDLVDLLRVDLVEMAPDDIHRAMDLLLGVEAALVVLEGDAALDDALADSLRLLRSLTVVHLEGV